MTREPAVAGQFYRADRESLLDEVGSMMSDCADKIDAVGVISPHAGYMYSGRVAGEVYSCIKPKPVYIILSPNHTGMGKRFSVSVDEWKTPLGTVSSDNELIDMICSRTPLLTKDRDAHMQEHSIEVQLPFLQVISPDAEIVPITLQYGSRNELKEFASAIAEAVKESGKDVTVVASSDMSHYESRESASRKDKLAIEKVLELDAEALLEVVEREDISMCGYVPSAVMIMYAGLMGAQKSKLIRYTDSGEVTGDTDQVVGYAGVVIY